jgi:hypothetical protein
VRDAAGELAHALEPLRLAQLRLEPLALGHVRLFSTMPCTSGVVELAGGRRLDVDPGAVGPRMRHSTGFRGASSRATAR